MTSNPDQAPLSAAPRIPRLHGCYRRAGCDDGTDDLDCAAGILLAIVLALALWAGAIALWMYVAG